MTSFHYSHWDPDLRWVQMCGYTIGLTFGEDGVRYDTLMCEDTWLQDTMFSYITPTFFGDYWMYSGSLAPHSLSHQGLYYHLVDTLGAEIEREVVWWPESPTIIPYASFSHVAPDTIMAYGRPLIVGADSFPQLRSTISSETYPTDDGNYVVVISHVSHEGQLHAFGLWSEFPYSNTRHAQPWIVYGTYRPLKDGDTELDTFRIIRYYPSVYDSLRSHGLNANDNTPLGEPYPWMPRPARRTLSAVPVVDACGRRYYASDGANLFAFNAGTGAMRLLDTLTNYNYGNRSGIIFTDNMPLQPNFYREPGICELWLDLDFDRSTLGGAAGTTPGGYRAAACAESEVALLDTDAVARTSRPADSLVVEITRAVSGADRLVTTLRGDSTYHVTGADTRRLVIHNDAFLRDSMFVALARSGVRLVAGDPDDPSRDTVVVTWHLHLSDSVAPVARSYVRIHAVPRAGLAIDTLVCEVGGLALPTVTADGATTLTWRDSLGRTVTRATDAGPYAYTATTSAGCDNADTLRLRLGHPDTSRYVYRACASEGAVTLVEHPGAPTVARDTLLTYRVARVAACDSVLVFDVAFSRALALPPDTLRFCEGETPSRWRGRDITEPGAYTELVGASACPDTARLVALAGAPPVAAVVARANCSSGAGRLTLPAGTVVTMDSGRELRDGDWVETGFGDSLTVRRSGEACAYRVPYVREVVQANYTGALSAPRVEFGEAFSWLGLSAPGADLTWTPVLPEVGADGQYRLTRPQFQGADSIVLSGTWSDGRGCTLRDELVVWAGEGAGMEIGLPTAFSPNGDGVNDVWQPSLKAGATLFDYRIFDRWGELIYGAGASGTGWDGSWREGAAMSGVYVVVVQYEDGSGQRRTIVSEVHLLR